MEHSLEITQSSDTLAYVLNNYLEKVCPPGIARHFHERGCGDTDIFTSFGAEAASRLKLDIPADVYVRWRSLEPIPYDSTWYFDQQAIPYLEELDSRPEIQAEFKRRGITPQ